jgi:arylsulfatase A-like enzyme
VNDIGLRGWARLGELCPRRAGAALLLGVLVLGCEATERSAAARPNVLFVVIDTARADYLSSYGFPELTTPAIDQLARTAVRYSQAYATSNWTLPSHASLFSGLYPSETRSTWETPQLPQEVVTLAERLLDAGYRTRAASGNPWISVAKGFGQGFEEFVEAWRATPERRPGPAVEEPIRWIREFAESREPFFIFLNFNTSHMPYDPAPGHRELFVDDTRSQERVAYLEGMKGDVLGIHGLDPEDFEIMRELYAAELHMVDWDLGRVLTALESSGLLEETLVIVTGDHGENIGEQGVVGHSLGMYEPTLRVPLILRFPERFPPGAVRDELVSLVDVMHTVLDVCGISADDQSGAIESRSLSGARHEPRGFVVAEADRPLHMLELVNRVVPERLSAIDHPVRAIRSGSHKLVWNDDQGLELFDLEADPAEAVNLSGELPAVQQRLLDYLAGWHSSLTSTSAVEASEIEDAETLEQLRELGYIQ